TSVTVSEGEVYVSPETAGKVVQVNVKVGDKVRKGQTLIVLGDSVATQIADIQSATAAKSLDLAKQSQSLTDQSAETSWQMSYLGVDAAAKSLNNSATSKKDAQDLYEEQLDGAELAVDAAEEAYDAAQDAVEAMQAASDDLAKIGVKQAKNGVDITKKGFTTQIHQLDYAIQMALIGYKNAITQLQLAQFGMGQQKIGAQTQVLQSESGSQIAQISANSKYITAPIDGVVTSISAEKGNTLAPGMPILKVENSKKLSITVALNSYEATLVKVGDEVKVEADNTKVDGTIISISPSLDSMTKKINVEILINNPKEITPGSIAKVYFSPAISGAIFIPLNSVYNAEDGQYVKVFGDGKIAFQSVEIGEITDDFVEITGGLKGNEKVIISSELFLDEGEKVKLLTDAVAK
ncbi:MAG: efflux RND transporter periplasmic adaptor subunit, partial [Candidatus Gracilibacteria bacterium]